MKKGSLASITLIRVVRARQLIAPKIAPKGDFFLKSTLDKAANIAQRADRRACGYIAALIARMRSLRGWTL
jgi:hypothetical protein